MVVKYVVSGGVAFGADFLTFVFLRQVGIILLIANPLARLIGAITAFLLNRHWTFRRDSPKAWWREALAYSLLWIFSTLLSTLVLRQLALWLPPTMEPISKLITEGGIVVINYFCSRHLVFKG
ncbi:MAG: GtrA family protein [Proteobacteria bacterium]|nr:GtrA family protein [Pseudomonadota bacterium]MBU1686087.1 GtrA family protein [Pseudomonadota bacterium]